MISYKGLVFEKKSGNPPKTTQTVVIQVTGATTTQVSATTDTSGNFAAVQAVYLAPGTYTAQAGIAGSPDYNPSLSDPVTFIVTSTPQDLAITLNVVQS